MRDAIAELETAVRLDPLSAEDGMILGMFRYLDRQYDSASEALTKALELEPMYWPAHSYLGRSYGRQGHFAQAEAAFRKASETDPTFAEPVSALGVTYALSGRKADAQRIVDDLQRRATYVSPYNIAVVYAALGDRDRAFAWLEKAYEART